MDRPAIITYVYEYADTPGAVELKELSPGVEASRGIRHHATVRFVGGIVTWDSVIGAWGRFFLMLLVSACGSTAPTAGSPTNTTEPTTTTPTNDAAFDPLVGRGEVELVADGYRFTEGPQWMSDDGVLLFTDVMANTIYQVAAGDEVTVFRKPSNYSNGLAVDPQGRLIAAESGARRLTRTDSDGTVTAIAERFKGARLNEPNDIAVRSDGTIYFTDPIFGDDAKAELDFRGVFRIAPDGGLTVERRGHTTEAPNGLALSPDETRLYVANSAGAGLVWIFDVAPDGSLSAPRTLAQVAGADGMTVDDAGNLFVSSSIGIEVFAPDGARVGFIAVPEKPSNCAFGGADGRTSYITAETSLYRVTLAHPGPY